MSSRISPSSRLSILQQFLVVFFLSSWLHDVGTNVASAFAPSGSNTRATGRHDVRSISASMSSGKDFFDGLKDWFNWDDSNDRDERPQNGGRQDTSDTAHDDELPAGTTLLLKIPAKQLKPGGLRLFLMFYLLGMQNTPDVNSWKANQPVSEEEKEEEGAYVLEMYFTDGTGMIQIELSQGGDSGDVSEVRVYRYGSLPSTAYLMQESVIVDGILDELHQCAFDESVAPEHRLLIPEPKSAIEDAREALAFG